MSVATNYTFVRTLYRGDSETFASVGFGDTPNQAYEALLYRKDHGGAVLSTDLQPLAAASISDTTIMTAAAQARFARARALPPKHVVVTVARSQDFSDTVPSGSAFLVANVQLETFAYERFEENVDASYLELRPIIQVRVPFSLSESPLDEVESKVGKTNSDSITFSGRSFPPNTVLFRGLSMDPYVNAEDDAVFPGAYVFSIRNDTWIREYKAASGTVGTSTIYQTATFGGTNFPV